MGIIEELREIGRSLEEKAEKYEDLRARGKWEKSYSRERKGFKINCKVRLAEGDSFKLREVYIEGELEEEQKGGNKLLTFLKKVAYSPRITLEGKYRSLEKFLKDMEEGGKVKSLTWYREKDFSKESSRNIWFEDNRYAISEGYFPGYRKCEGKVKAEKLDECYGEPHFVTLSIKELEKEILPLHKFLIGEEVEDLL